VSNTEPPVSSLCSFSLLLLLNILTSSLFQQKVQYNVQGLLMCNYGCWKRKLTSKKGKYVLKKRSAEEEMH
jgi:hypothetical protein